MSKKKLKDFSGLGVAVLYRISFLLHTLELGKVWCHRDEDNYQARRKLVCTARIGIERTKEPLVPIQYSCFSLPPCT